MTDSTQRRLPYVGYLLLAAAVFVGFLVVQSYARDTRVAVREQKRLTLVVAQQTKQIAAQTKQLADQTEQILAARRSGCEDNNDRWSALGDVLRPFQNPNASPQQQKTLADLLRIAEPRDCSAPKGTP